MPSGLRYAGASVQVRWVVAAGIAAVTLAVVLNVWKQSGDVPRESAGSLQQERLDSARAAIERGQLNIAASLLKQMRSVEPIDGEVLLLSGQVARELGDPSAAEKFWEQIDDSDESHGAVARYLEATLAFERRRLAVGEQLLIRATELDPGYLPARERLARLNILLLRPDAARRHLLEVRAHRPWSARDLAQFRMAAGIVDDPQRVIPLLQSYLASDPEHQDCLAALLQYLIAAGRIADGLMIVGDLDKRLATAPQIAAKVAGMHLKNGDPHSAAEVLRAVENLDESLDLRRAQGFLACAQSDWQTAIDALSRVVQANPDDIEATYNLGLAYQRLQAHGESQRLLLKTQLLDRAFTQAERLLVVDEVRPVQARPIVLEVARLLVRLDRQVEALYWYELAVSWDPDDSIVAHEVRQVAAQLQGGGSLATLIPPEPRDVRAVGTPELEAAPGLSDPAERLPPSIRFRDDHSVAGLEFRYFTGESSQKYLLESLGGGVAVLDMDRDGWPDLYFPQGCRLPFQAGDRTFANALYRNRAVGSFAEVGGPARVDDNQYGQGCAAADFDNDGFPDLAVGNYGHLLLYRNNGDGTFTEIAAEAGMSQSHWTSSLGWGDLDRDGSLDLYVVNYLLEAEKVCRDASGTPRTCSPENYPAEPDRLFHNQGNGTFADVTADAAVTAADGKGIGVVIADLDADGWPDVYVANDGTPNHLYRNRGGHGDRLRFEELGVPSGAAVRGDGAAQAGMGIACADLTGDETLDLYVTHFHGDYNTLYRNEGQLLFSDVTLQWQLAAPTFPLLGFGCQPVDFDLDGWEDLIIANGHIDDFRDQQIPWQMPPQLFWNRSGQRFEDLSAAAGPYFASAQIGRGLARLDWNRDGLVDVAIVNQDRPVALLTNTTRAVGNWLTLKLIGVRSNRSAIGARIHLSIAGRSLMREVIGGDGFSATNEAQVVIGMGEAPMIEQIQISWPSGLSQTLRDIPANTSWDVVEGQGTWKSSSRAPIPGSEHD